MVSVERGKSNEAKCKRQKMAGEILLVRLLRRGAIRSIPDERNTGLLKFDRLYPRPEEGDQEQGLAGD